MAFLHPAVWHDHDIDFARWLHPAIMHVALGSRLWIHLVTAPAMWHVDLESWRWIYQVAAPCNVICGPRMTCHWIRPNVCHIGILHLVSILTIITAVDMSFCTICKILSKSDHPRQKKMTSCRFSRWQMSTIFDFRGPIMGSLKSPCTTSYRSSMETIALNCLVFEKIASFCILATECVTFARLAVIDFRLLACARQILCGFILLTYWICVLFTLLRSRTSTVSCWFSNICWCSISVLALVYSGLEVSRGQRTI